MGNARKYLDEYRNIQKEYLDVDSNDDVKIVRMALVKLLNI